MSIIICPRCGGCGEAMEHHVGQGSEMIVCPACNGSGRIMERQFTLTAPYSRNTKAFDEAVNQILTIIQNYNNV